MGGISPSSAQCVFGYAVLPSSYDCCSNPFPVPFQYHSCRVSAAATERNWSLMGHFFDKRKSRIASKTLLKIVYCAANAETGLRG